MSRITVIVAGTALAIAASTACATKKFVRTNVGEVSNNVESMASSLEETQNQVQENTARIEKADQSADSAMRAANQAADKAASAGKLVDSAETHTDVLEKASRKLIYDVVMSEEGSGFGFDSAVLPEAAKEAIDDLVAKVKQAPANVFITIEGYTDNVGSRAFNDRLGLERARAVRRYLHERHQIPLHKMEVISYGEAMPAAPNTTTAGRAENRRVEIKVMS